MKLSRFLAGAATRSFLTGQDLEGFEPGYSSSSFLGRGCDQGKEVQPLDEVNATFIPDVNNIHVSMGWDVGQLPMVANSSEVIFDAVTLQPPSDGLANLWRKSILAAFH